MGIITHKPYSANVRALGNISGFSKISTGMEDGNAPSNDHDYTELDLYKILKEFRDNLDIKFLEKLELIIVKHSRDKNNPHQTTFDDLDTTITTELYREWTKQGNIGSLDYFIKVLFQFIELATIEETIEGTNTDKVAHPLGIKNLLTNHNEDKNAHDKLLEQLCPGEYIKSVPTFSIDSIVGIPKMCSTIVRNGPMYIFDHYGTMKELSQNTLETDYSLSVPTLPIFGKKINEFLHSENFKHDYWVKHNCSIGSSATIRHLRDNKLYSEILTEDSTTSQHYISTQINIIPDTTYTISIYIKPINRTMFTINLPDLLNTTNPYIHYDLSSNKIIIPENSNTDIIMGNIYKLTDGWYRCTLTFKSSFYPNMNIRLCSTKDANLEYTGENQACFALFGATVVKGSLCPPYILSTDTNGGLFETKVKINLSSLIYPVSNTIILTTNNPGIISDNNIKTGYVLADTTKTILNGCFTELNEFRFAQLNDREILITEHISKKNITDEYVTSVQGYDRGKSIFGYSKDEYVLIDPVVGNITSNTNTLYLGYDPLSEDKYLNGYIHRIIIYPTLLSLNNINFFTEEV